MNAEEFSGKTVLVTGASRGIGRAIALAFKDRGAFVIASARPSKELDSLSKILGEHGEIWAGDATGGEFLMRITAMKQLDILVNNICMVVFSPTICVFLCEAIFSFAADF